MDDRARRRARRSATWSLAGLLALAGCTRDTSNGRPAVWLGESSDPVVVVIGVVDLRASHLPSLPGLTRALAGAAVFPDAMSAGAGAAAALSLIDGRAPLEHLRAPADVLGQTRESGWDAAVLAVPATLRSEPEWIDAGLRDTYVRSAREHLPALGGVPTARAWRVLLVDPFSRENDPLVVPAGGQDPEGRDWIDTVLAAWIDEVRRGPDAHRTHVVLTGIPRAPARDQRARALPGNGPVPEALSVPFVWAPPIGRPSPTMDTSSSVLVHEQIARSLGRPHAPATPRWSAWWSDYSGGLYLELPDEDGVTITRAWMDERGRWNAVADQVERDLIGPRTARLDAAALALGFTTAPRLWCAVRGSTDLDFVDLSFVADGIDSLVTGWGLEDIDLVRTETPRMRTFALAAEPRADGAIVDLGWPPRTIEIRVRGEMSEASLLGIGMHAGSASRAIGIGSVRLAPFTRTFWRAAAGGWPLRADGWWEDAAVGVHLVISDQAAAPLASVWED